MMITLVVLLVLTMGAFEYFTEKRRRHGPVELAGRWEEPRDAGGE